MDSNQGSQDPPTATSSQGSSDADQPLPTTSLGLNHLPVIPLHRIGSFLKGIDFLNFTESDPSIYSAFEGCDISVWKKRVQEECTAVDPVIEARATAMLGSSNTSCLDRLKYSFHFRVIDHWKRGLYKTALTLPRSEYQAAAADGNRLVVATLKPIDVYKDGYIFKQRKYLSIQVWNCVTGHLHDYTVEIPSAIYFRSSDVKLIGQILVIRGQRESIYSHGIRLDEQEKKATVIWTRKGGFFLNSNSICHSSTSHGEPNFAHCYSIETGEMTLNFSLYEPYGEYYESTAGGDWFVFATQSAFDVKLHAVNTRLRTIQTLPMPMGYFQRKRPNAMAINEDHLVAYHKGHIYIWNLTSSELIKDITTDIPSCLCAPFCPYNYISEGCSLMYIPKIVQFCPARKEVVIHIGFFDRNDFLLKIKDGTHYKVPVPKFFKGKWSGIGEEIIHAHTSYVRGPVHVWVGNVCDPENIASYTIDNSPEVLLTTPTHLVVKTEKSLEILDFLHP